MNSKTDLLFPQLSYIIQGCVFEIRNHYGPGQKEVIYHRLLDDKLTQKGLSLRREFKIEVYSEDTGKVIGFYQPDILVNESIIIEVKSSRFTTSLDEKQLYYYLRNSRFELGYLINFSTPQLFIKRIVYGNHRKPFLKR